MRTVARGLNRQEAKMIAEELFTLLRKDCEKVTREIVEADREEYLTIKEAADLLKCSPKTLYNTKCRITDYVKIGNQLRFPKSKLLKHLGEGKYKAENVP